jgi:FdhD protein
MREVEILRIDVSAKKTQRMKDSVAEEKPLFVFLNNVHYATILCSPSNLEGLVVGRLLSEDVIEAASEIEKLELSDETCHVRIKDSVNTDKPARLSRENSRAIHSLHGKSPPYCHGEGPRKLEPGPVVKADIILDCVGRLDSMAETFTRTGGVHIAVIYRSNGALVGFAEDVSRHNAVDKVIGIAAMRKTDFRGCLLALSCRLTGDIVRKAAKVAIPVVASLAAAVDSGIDVAEEAGLTLVGFVRAGRMNVYASPERILA